jgi:predicted PurR-regulated permease PerM
MARSSPPSQVSPKTAATVALTILFIGFWVWFLWRTAVVLALTMAAVLIAVALNRAVHWLEEHRVPRGIGILLSVLAVFAALVGLGFLLVPPAVTQVSALITHWPDLLQKLQQSEVFRFADRYLSVNELIGRLRSQGASLVGNIVNPALDVITWMGRLVFAAVTVLFLVIFMLAAGHPLVLAALAQIAPENRPRYVRVLLQIYHALGGYIAGLFLIVLINSACTSIFLAVVGVPFFLPLGVAAGFASLVPYAGATLAGAVITLVAWVSNGTFTGVGTAIYFVAYQQFENHVISPMIYGRVVELNPLVIILAALFFADLFGLTGAILAVPLTAIGQVILREILADRRERLQIPAQAEAEALRAEEGGSSGPH